MSEIGYEVIYRVLAVLQGRKGFDEWWDGIDLETQVEIVDELRKVEP